MKCDGCRREIGEKAARIVGDGDARVVELVNGYGGIVGRFTLKTRSVACVACGPEGAGGMNGTCAFCGINEATHLADSGSTPQRTKPEPLLRCERCRDAAERNAELDAFEAAGFEEVES